MQQTIIGPPFGWLHRAMDTILHRVSVIIDRTIAMARTASISALAIETVCYILPGRYTAVLSNLPLPLVANNYFRKYPNDKTPNLNLLLATDCFLSFI